MITQAHKSCLLDPESAGEWFSLEAKSIEMPTLKYFSNYHAWSYRVWLLHKILHDERVPSEQKNLILENELEFSNSWMNTQVSDYCGHHYRQKLLQLSMKAADINTTGPEDNSYVSKLAKELEDNANRIKMYEGHESLWCHRRAVMKMILEHVHDNPNTVQDVHDKEKIFVRSVLENRTESSMECTKLNSGHCEKYVTWSNANQFSQFNWSLDTSLQNIM